MGLLSKKFRKKLKKVAKRSKPGSGGILSQIRRRGGFAGAIPLPRRDLFISRLKDLRDRNIDFGTDFSKRSGSGGFIPGGTGRLIPIRDTFSVGMPSPDLPVLARPHSGSPRSGKPRLGFGLGELLPRIKDKVPLAPAFSGMPIPQMVGQPQMLPQPIPRVPVEENISEISTPGFAMRDVQMDMIEPRMMMADGDVALSEEAATDSLVDFLNSDPEQVAFGQSVAGESSGPYDDEVLNSIAKETPMTALILSKQSPEQSEFVRNLIGATGMMVGAAESIPMFVKRLITTGSLNAPQVEQIAGKTVSNMDREILGETGRTISNMDIPEMAGGGEASFPDLTGDGKVTQADILKGRGVFAEGDEVSMMLMEMDEPAEMPEEEMEDVDMLMDEIADVAPAAQMLDQYINMVVEMIQAGASEEEIIQMLVEAGLDEEDINAVFQAVIEALEGPSIDSELAALG